MQSVKYVSTSWVELNHIGRELIGRSHLDIEAVALWYSSFKDLRYDMQNYRNGTIVIHGLLIPILQGPLEHASSHQA